MVLISQASSEHSICFAIPDEQGVLAQKTVEKAFFFEINHYHSIQKVLDRFFLFLFFSNQFSLLFLGLFVCLLYFFFFFILFLFYIILIIYESHNYAVA